MRGNWYDELKVLFKGYIFVDKDKIEDVAMEFSKIPTLTKIIKSVDEMAPVSFNEEKFLADMLEDDYVLRVSQGIIIGNEVEILKRR